MAKLTDFNCRYAEYRGMTAEDAQAMGLSLPDAYLHGETIARLIPKNGVLPLDPVLEAENLGALIKLDDSPLGPRKAEDAISGIEQLSEIGELDPQRGRLMETLKAVELINQSGGSATIEMHGPIPVITGLTDMMKVLVGWRKHPEVLDTFFQKLIDGLTKYACAARKAGCQVLYYTDSPGSLNILGPKYAKQITESFTVPFLKALDEQLDSQCVVHLCPKTSFLLTGFEKARWKTLPLNETMAYTDACRAACGRVRFLGQRCRKDKDIQVDRIHYLELL